MWANIDIPESEIDTFTRAFSKKSRFIVDENLGEELARELRRLKFNAVFVGDVGLKRHSDEDVFAFGWRDDRIILTQDRDFLSDRNFPQHENPGIVVLPGTS